MKVFDPKAAEYQNLDKNLFQFTQIGETLSDSKFETEPVGFFKDAMIRFAKNKTSVTAFVFICIIAVMAIIGPGMNKYGFNDQHHDLQDLPPRVPVLENIGIFDGSRVMTNRRMDSLSDPEKYPNDCVMKVFNEKEVHGVKMCDVKVNYYKYIGAEDEYYWFGTDYLGRDLWTRLWRGARVSLLIAIISVACNVCIGIVYGSIAGYYGGKVDMLMMRICEIIGAFPNLVIITLFIMFFGTGLFSIIMALVVQDWIGTARMIRAQFYRYKGSEYVLAARTLGVSDRVLIFRHVLPNAIGPIITSAMIAVPGAIFAESFLAYIGLGLQAPEPSIGVLLSQGQKVLLHFPTQVLFPAILISVLMISFNMFANGLRDAFDPTQRGA